MQPGLANGEHTPHHKMRAKVTKSQLTTLNGPQPIVQWGVWGNFSGARTGLANRSTQTVSWKWSAYLSSYCTENWAAVLFLVLVNEIRLRLVNVEQYNTFLFKQK